MNEDKTNDLWTHLRRLEYVQDEIQMNLNSMWEILGDLNEYVQRQYGIKIEND